MTPDTPTEDEPALPECPIINGFVLAAQGTAQGTTTPTTPDSHDYSPSHQPETRPNAPPHASPTPSQRTSSQPLTLADWTRAETAKWPFKDVDNASTHAVQGNPSMSMSIMSGPVTVPGEEALVLTLWNPPTAATFVASNDGGGSSADIYELSAGSGWADEYHFVESHDNELDYVPRTETEAVIAEMREHPLVGGEIGLVDTERMIEGLLERQREEMYVERWRGCVR
ncbi:hypothetical protein OQA88_1750 [Cercophora sp. LCS_1]